MRSRIGSFVPLFFGLDGCSPAMFFLVEVLALPSNLDVKLFPVVKDILFLSVRYIGPIGVKTGEYCATCSLDGIKSTCGGTLHTITKPLIDEVTTDVSRSSRRFIWTPRHVSWTERDNTTPGRTPDAVRSPQANSQVLIGGISVLPTRGLPDPGPQSCRFNRSVKFGSVADAN